jgi:hypothetical protein
MKDKDKSNTLTARQSDEETKNISKGYPLYPESEDIYNNDQDNSDIDPDDIYKSDELIDEEDGLSIEEYDDISDESNSDLDVPGSELDDDMEEIGSEDEENNYYSIGGDDHEDLDEDHED